MIKCFLSNIMLLYWFTCFFYLFQFKQIYISHLIWISQKQLMYQIEKQQKVILHLKYGDKEGTSVLKRLASISNQVSSTLILGDAKMPRINKNYVEDCATRIVSLYKEYNPKQTFETIVLGSPHQTGVYIAQLMNVPFLPIQFIGFAQNLQSLDELNCLKIIGCDYDYTHLCWVWCKIGSVKQMPKSYLDVFQKAKNIIVVRSNSEFRLKGKSDFCMGKVNHNTYVHSSIKLWKKVPQNLQTLISPPTQECQRICQWQFGLPDQTLNAITQIWEEIHPQIKQNLQIIQKPTVDLYKFIPFLYFEYYKQTKTPIQGISLNPYYTLHPYYEKKMTLVPFVYYNFKVLQSYFQSMLDQIQKHTSFKVQESTCICFANMVEKEKDLQVIKKFWKRNGLEKGWFSVGFDCILARKIKNMQCKNVFGDVPSPHLKILEWTNQHQKNKVQQNSIPPISVEILMRLWQEFKFSLVQSK